MDAIDYWRLCDELTVVQAALLIIGLDPAGTAEYVEGWKPEEKPAKYIPVLNALQRSVVSGQLTATKVWKNLSSEDPDAEHPVRALDWASTCVAVSDLHAWLADRGIAHGFFFPEGPVTTDYLNETDDCYSPKLAAAVTAWKAVKAQRAAKQSPRSVKQDVQLWLKLHAADFELVNEDDGEIMTGPIEDIAKIVNWDKRGGAPRTPQSSENSSAEPTP